MSAVAGIGFLIKYVLISGQERWVVYGDNVELFVLGMDRHEWGNIHLIIGLVLLGLLVLHIYLHWKLVTCVYNRIFQKKLVYKLITVLFIIICTLFIFGLFLAKPKVSKAEHGKGREATNDSHIKKERNRNEKENLENTKSIEIHENPKQVVEIRGYMTLDDVSKKYKVPAEYIKTKLDIPKSVSDKQRLSSLRKKYDIEMSDVEEIINEYQEENE